MRGPLCAAILVAVCIFISGSAVMAMTQTLARSCFNPTQTRHDITTSSTCYMSGYTQDRLLGRWWQGTCDAGYITIAEYQTADNQKRRYVDSTNPPSGFNFESNFACLLPASSTVETTIPVYELYNSAITDYAYVIDFNERFQLLQNGYTDLGILGRAENFNRQVRLKQCVQTGNTIHNWVFEEDPCPTNYVEELVLSGVILTNCDGETNTDLVTLYKYYSATGSHRYLGTATTAPSGYNITPVGCFLKSTASTPNKVPIYSYSYISGTDKDSLYRSTSVSVTSPWTNDNTIIGYTLLDQTTEILLACLETSGRYYYTTTASCPSGTTFHHVVSSVFTLPCAENQLELKAMLNGNIRRLAVDAGQYPSGSSAPGAGFSDEYVIGCVVSANTWGENYPAMHALYELIPSNGNAFAVSYYDGLHTDTAPGSYVSNNTIALAPSRFRRNLISCYDNENTRQYFTTNFECPAHLPYSMTIGRVAVAPCLSGETAINSYLSGTNRRLAASAPSGYTFERLIACAAPSTIDLDYTMEYYKSAETDYIYQGSFPSNMIYPIPGLTLQGAVDNVYNYGRDMFTVKSCWNSTKTYREYFKYGAGCPSGQGWNSDESAKFTLWQANTEPNLVKLRQFYNATYTDSYWTTDSTGPSDYPTEVSSFKYFIKSVQEIGTYPLYQFRRTGLTSGRDTFLAINNTYIPPGYSQLGGVLGYVFGTYPVEGCLPIYKDCASIYNNVKSCRNADSSRLYRFSYIGCPGGTTDEGVAFRSIYCSANYIDLLSPGAVMYCQATKAGTETDTIILPCSSSPPSGYTMLDTAQNVGCFTPTNSVGLAAVYQNTKTESGNIDTYYGYSATPLSGYTSTFLGYGMETP